MAVNIKVAPSFRSETSSRAGEGGMKTPEKLLHFTTGAPERKARVFPIFSLFMDACLKSPYYKIHVCAIIIQSGRLPSVQSVTTVLSGGIIQYLSDLSTPRYRRFRFVPLLGLFSEE
jgi:hypothetical protein